LKRFIIPLLLTLLLHGLSFHFGRHWLKQASRQKPRPVAVSLKLTYLEPSKSVVTRHKELQQTTLRNEPLKKPEKPLSPAPRPAEVHEKKPSPVKKEERIRKVFKKPADKPEKKLKTIKGKTPKISKPLLKPSRANAKQEEDTIHTKIVPQTPPSSEQKPMDEIREGKIREDFNLFSDVPKQPHEDAPVKGDRSMASLPPAQTIREAIPLYRENPRPQYPSIARKRGYEGKVLLEVLVNPDGKVGDVRVLDSSGHGVLDRAALKAVKKWLFEPGTRGNEKVAMWVKIPIRFQLEE
jgi:protein TonB